MEAGSNFGSPDPEINLREALDRTLFLMRDEVGNLPTDEVLLSALTSTRVGLVADEANIASPAAQVAFATAAMLMARSGHEVYVRAPDIVMTTPQPPLRPGGLISRLLEIGQDLLPGVTIRSLHDDQELDLVVMIGSSPTAGHSDLRIRLNAEAWAGSILPEGLSTPWDEQTWPVGALIAAGLAASEAFKIAMMKLEPLFLNAGRSNAMFAGLREFTYRAGPHDMPCVSNLGEIDFISGGAISNAALYAIARVPGVQIHGRIIEPDTAATSNLNRYLLLLRSNIGGAKAEDLSTILAAQGLQFMPIPVRFDVPSVSAIGSLAPTTVVGADDIPTRWLAQAGQPELLIIGATSHWSTMASFHTSGLGCAQCLHTEDDPTDAPIPTTACVSFWAGLLVAICLLQGEAGRVSTDEQQIYLTPFRPERPFKAKVPVLGNCPTCHGNGAAANRP